MRNCSRETFGIDLPNNYQYCSDTQTFFLARDYMVLLLWAVNAASLWDVHDWNTSWLMRLKQLQEAFCQFVKEMPNWEKTESNMCFHFLNPTRIWLYFPTAVAIWVVNSINMVFMVLSHPFCPSLWLWTGFYQCDFFLFFLIVFLTLEWTDLDAE